MSDKFDELRKKIVENINFLTRVTLAFASAAVLFQLTTSVRLFDLDVVSNFTRLLSYFGYQKLVGILSVSLLYFLITNKVSK